jgi:serine/threonine protein kinase
MQHMVFSKLFLSKRDFTQKWVVTGDLGSGGFAEVKKVRHYRKGTVAALKVIKKCNLDSLSQSRALQETEFLRTFTHENIVKCLDSHEDSQNIYAVLEYVNGGELYEKIVKDGCNEFETRTMASQLLSAVKYLHERNIIHRDIKPENILLSTSTSSKTSFDIKLIDFGLSTFVSGSDQKGCHGTPEFMAPEIIRKEFYGKPVDAWSIGITLFIMLGGYFPFRGTSDKETFDLSTEGTVKFPQKYWKNISSEAIQLIKSLLRKDPHQRLTVEQALNHPWFQIGEDELKKKSVQLDERRKSKNVQKNFQKAVNLVKTVQYWKRISVSTSSVKSNSKDSVLPDSLCKRKPPTTECICRVVSSYSPRGFVRRCDDFIHSVGVSHIYRVFFVAAIVGLLIVSCLRSNSLI